MRLSPTSYKSSSLFIRVIASENCSLPADIILESSDKIQLGAHSKNLELFSDAFPTVGSTLPPSGAHDVVKLSETAEVIALMLRFTHNQPAPDLSSLDIHVLLGLGEAVHKYGMHYASQFVTLEVK